MLWTVLVVFQWGGLPQLLNGPPPGQATDESPSCPVRPFWDVLEFGALVSGPHAEPAPQANR